MVHLTKRGTVTAILLLASSVGLNYGALDAASRGTAGVEATGNMTAVRFDHAAALLDDGRVLIVGGISRNGVMQSTAEVFDPSTRRFARTGQMQTQHGWGVSATSLRNGKVLIAGGSSGCDAPCFTASAELYDPGTGTFASTGNMTVPRAGARTALLPNGDVLFVGGTDSREGESAERYHPASGTFAPAGQTRVSGVARLVLMKNGRVLVLGSSEADLYDPSSGRFSPTGAMKLARQKFGAALLPDGRVLVIGGQSDGARGPRLTSTELYDPGTGRFSSGPDLETQRFKLTKAVVALKDGRVLVAGGADHPEIYDPASNSFRVVDGERLDGFYFSTATLLTDGRVLLAGGYATPGGSGVDHAWLFRPQ